MVLFTTKVATKPPISVRSRFFPFRKSAAIHFKPSRASLILGFGSKVQRFNSPQIQHNDFHHDNFLCFRSCWPKDKVSSNQEIKNFGIRMNQVDSCLQQKVRKERASRTFWTQDKNNIFWRFVELFVFCQY